jgi:hypothetical protein
MYEYELYRKSFWVSLNWKTMSRRCIFPAAVRVLSTELHKQRTHGTRSLAFFTPGGTTSQLITILSAALITRAAHGVKLTHEICILQ